VTMSVEAFSGHKTMMYTLKVELTIFHNLILIVILLLMEESSYWSSKFGAKIFVPTNCSQLLFGTN